MALFFQQMLLVASDTFGEFIRGFVRCVKRGDGDGVDSGQSGTHGFCLAAKQIDVCIIDRLVETRCFGVDCHFAHRIC